jgi:hypothetical protein
MTFSHNENKEVKIVGSDSSTFNQDNNRSWRNNLSTIITGLQDNAGTNETIVGMNLDTSKLNVSSVVYLCMESLPTLKFSVGTNEGLKDLITGLVGDTKIGKSKTSQSVLTRALAAVNAIASVSSTISGSDATAGTLNPWSLYSPTWNEEQVPFTFSQEFHFRMGQYKLWNAKEEVVKPLLNLIAPVMNQQIGSVFTKGPFPSCLDLLGKCLSNIDSYPDYLDGGTTGETVTTAIEGIKKNGVAGFTNLISAGVDLLGNLIQSLVLCGYRKYTYDVKFGNFMSFYKVMYTDAEVKWSTETDQYGFPIAGSATIGFKSILPPAITSKNQHTMFANFDGLGQ